MLVDTAGRMQVGAPARLLGEAEEAEEAEAEQRLHKMDWAGWGSRGWRAEVIGEAGRDERRHALPAKLSGSASRTAVL